MKLVTKGKQAEIWLMDNGHVLWLANQVEAHNKVLVGWHLCQERLYRPHFPTVFALGERDGVPFVELECVDGSTPTEWSGPEAYAILTELREAKIFHRDFRLANIIKRKSGKWCLVDFGFACEYGNEYEAPWYLGAEARSPNGPNDGYAVTVIKKRLSSV